MGTPLNEDQKFRMEHMEEKVQNIVNGLRRMAEDVERTLERHKQNGNSFEMVQDIQHTINWGIPNLNIDSLINDLYMLYIFKDEKIGHSINIKQMR